MITLSLFSPKKHSLVQAKLTSNASQDTCILSNMMFAFDIGSDFLQPKFLLAVLFFQLNKIKIHEQKQTTKKRDGWYLNLLSFVSKAQVLCWSHGYGTFVHFIFNRISINFLTKRSQFLSHVSKQFILACSSVSTRMLSILSFNTLSM